MILQQKNKQRLLKISEFLADCDCKIIHNPNAFDEDQFDDTDEEFDFPDLDSLFKDSGIRIMFKDSPYSACISSKGRLLGALVAHQDGYWEWGEEPIPVYYFSRAVHPECRNQGIAKKLLQNFMSAHSGCIIKSETYNRILDKSLLEAGFKEEWEESNGSGSVKLHTFVPERMRDDYFSKDNSDESRDHHKRSKIKRQNIIFKIAQVNGMLEKAIQEFGTTYDINEAGYVLPDGTMLDFSEKRNGGQQGSRAQDHRVVEKFVSEKFEHRTDAMNYFMKQTGAIRVSFWGDYGLVDAETKPTPEQIDVIRRAIIRKNSVDLSIPNSSDVEEFNFEFDRSERARFIQRLRDM